jgi:hypothetical protein
MTLKKGEGADIERGSTRPYSLENWFWKRFWNCRKTYNGMNE